ncbi:MAG: hypothetical protein QOI00_80 [Chloroflexota bacterium]|nr:hypothetical protein [Chloroflexota bacterium]MEA2605323.1 hypothetical protein [Chloroflexota bacterium]
MQTERLDIAAPRRRPAGRQRTLTVVFGLLALVAQLASGPVRAAGTWTTNLYVSKAFLYQDPYASACTAASAMIMLNTIAYRGSGGSGFRWTPYRVKNNLIDKKDPRDMTSILSFERSHDTLSSLGSGSDPHGWRNALNLYGWGSAALTDPAMNVYQDLEFTTYEAAVHAAIRAIAIYGMPVGIPTWAGRHAQVMTGYVVDGEDPAISDAFTVRYVYISDPLRSDGYVNTRITNMVFRAGSLHIRFQRYRETDSPYDDGYQPGWRRSSVSPTRGVSEWYGRWVIIAPIRAGLPLVPPPPSPTPDPSPTPSASPTPDASATPAASAPASEAPASEAPPATPADAPADASPSAAASDVPSTSPEPSPAP